MTLDHTVRTLYRSRQQFLEAEGHVAELPGVRSDILASWRRSLHYGLEPERSRPTFGDTGHAEQLVHATRRVIEPRLHHLSDSRASLALTDQTGRLLVRWVEDGSFERRLDHHDVLPGFSFAEATIGTNSGGMVLETGKPSLVAGPEHFFEESLQLTCAGAPVRHPVTRRILGTLNLTCAFEQTSQVLLAWVSDLCREIEQCLVEQTTTREQALLAAYLAADHGPRQALICLDEHTLVSNATAARLLAPSDQAVLWEIAGRRIHSPDTHREEHLTLADGTRAAMFSQPVLDAGTPVGALVRLRLIKEPAVESASGQPAAPTTSLADLPGLVGRSQGWTRMRRALADHPRRTLALVGERGTGRAAVARAWLRGQGIEAIRTIDAAAVEAVGGDQFLADLTSAAADGCTALVVTHVDAVPSSLAAGVTAALESARRRGLRVVGTCTTHAAASGAPLLEWFEGQVEVPSLADRPEDVALLLEDLSWRLVGGLERQRWTSEAIQTVARADWPTNVAGLAALVRRVMTGPAMDRVTAAHLPATVKTRAARRRLVGLERVEAQAIMEALEAADGNKKAAADALGIARSTLYRKVRALGIEFGGSTF